MVRIEWNVRYVGFCWLCVLQVVSYVACLVGVCDCDLCLAVFEWVCGCLLVMCVCVCVCLSELFTLCAMC